VPLYAVRSVHAVLPSIRLPFTSVLPLTPFRQLRLVLNGALTNNCAGQPNTQEFGHNFRNYDAETWI
jgi:hypothetical protein